METMLRAAVLLLLCSGVFSITRVYPRLHLVGDVDAADLFKPPEDVVDTFSDWTGPLDPPLQKPQSYRTVNFPWQSINSAPLVPAQLTLTFAAPLDGATVFDYKFEAPYLEVDPWTCADPNAPTFGNCRCNADDAANYAVRHTATANFASVATVAGTRVVTLQVPNWNYWPHAPFPGQHPFLRTFRKLCFRRSGDATWIDTTVWISVAHGCDSTGTRVCTAQATTPALSVSWNRVTLPDPAISSGWECNAVGYLGEMFTFDSITATPVTYARDGINSNQYVPEFCWGETREMTAARYLRTSCCGARDNSIGFFGQTAKVGICYNPEVESCCGWKPFNPKFEQCCSRWYARINYVDQSCKCTGDNNVYDCQGWGANLQATITDRRGETDAAKTTRQCCVLSTNSVTGYPELALLKKFGMCYDTASHIQCCDDGHIYDPAVQQCCRINGVQTLDTPCPCSSDAHCPTQKICCMQQFPKSWEDAQLAPNKGHCSRYANWPVLNAPAEVQRCPGTCIDSRFQTCCNGVACVREYEKCCNSTCCNRRTSKCVEGHRPGAVGDGARVNPLDYLVPFELCTSLESMSALRGFWVWGMPTFWLFATVTAFAIVVVVARRATENVFEYTERGMVFFAVLLICLGLPHYFSPSYKYGIVTVFVGLFSIVGAVMQSPKLSLLVVVAVFLLMNYYVDPFNGNIYLSFAGGLAPQAANPQSTLNVATNGETPFASGILIFLARLDRIRADCTNFYDYFQRDFLIIDAVRVENPNKPTFGFCTRAWMTALAIFSGAAVTSMLVLFMLSIFSFTKKLADRAPKEEIEFEVRPVLE